MKRRRGTIVKPLSLPLFFDLCYLLAVEQKFAVASGGVIVVSAVEILGDIHVFHPDLTVVHIAESIGQRGFALADRLDFRSGQHKASGESVTYGIVEGGTSVLYVNIF